MSDPHIAQKSPFVVELEPEREYWYCACGFSREQPWCDGSHKEHGMAPQTFTVETKGKYGICGCRRSNNLPFCDGSHKSLK